MSVQVGRITWRFSNVISQEELESSLLSVEHAFIVGEARLSLGEEPVVFNITDSDDVERVEEFLANRMSMHGTQFQRKMASVLSCVM